VACHIAKGGLLNVIGREIQSIKEITELKAVASSDMYIKVMWCILIILKYSDQYQKNNL
jgi:hypothetical protein